MIAVAAAAPWAVCGLLVPLRNVVENTNAALVLVLVVVGVAATGQRAAGVVAADRIDRSFTVAPNDYPCRCPAARGADRRSG